MKEDNYPRGYKGVFLSGLLEIRKAELVSPSFSTADPDIEEYDSEAIEEDDSEAIEADEEDLSNSGDDSNFIQCP